MKVLIAILACHKRKEYCDYQRQTWIKEISRVQNTDYRFFLGNHPEDTLSGKIEFEDEIWLNCEDGYSYLSFKVYEIFKWALKHEYDYVFKCDDDTHVEPYALIEQSNFGKYDYTGMQLENPSGLIYASGGAGYWVSKKAMEILTVNPVVCPIENSAEDAWVGETLRKNGIILHHDYRYVDYRILENIISASEFPAEKMLERHGKKRRPGTICWDKNSIQW